MSKKITKYREKSTVKTVEFDFTANVSNHSFSSEKL